MADPHAREGRGADLQVLASLNQVCVCLHQITAGRVARRRRGIEYIGEPEKRSRSRTKASWGDMEGERGNNYTRKAEGTITLEWKPTRLGVEVETRQESNRVTRNGRRGNKARLTKPNPKAAWGDRPNNRGRAFTHGQLTGEACVHGRASRPTSQVPSRWWGRLGWTRTPPCRYSPSPPAP